MGQACKIGEWRRKGDPPVPTKLNKRTCVAFIPRPASRRAFSTGMQSPARFHYRRYRRLALQTPRQRDHATYRCAFHPPCSSSPNSTKSARSMGLESLLFANIQAHGSSQFGISRRRIRPRCSALFRATPCIGANVNADRRKNSERLAQLGRFLSALEVRDEHKTAPRQVGNLLLRVAFRFAERPYRTPKIGRIVNFYIITSVII